jgi:CheY-like chemotaxis protein
MNARLKALCVDDNEEAARCAALLLEQAGFEARACFSGADALAVAEELCPDVCIIDLSMPDMAGDELAHRLREQAGERPLRFIALTGRWDINAQHRTHNAGFEEHLVKPVEPTRLIEVVSGRQAVGAE